MFHLNFEIFLCISAFTQNDFNRSFSEHMLKCDVSWDAEIPFLKNKVDEYQQPIEAEIGPSGYNCTFRKVNTKLDASSDPNEDEELPLSNQRTGSSESRHKRQTLKEPMLRIVSGHRVEQGGLPYQIALRKLYKNKAKRPLMTVFCGGTLIKNTKVISAAHCFVNSISRCCNSGIVKEKKLRHAYAVGGVIETDDVYRSNDSLTFGQWRSLKTVVYPRWFDKSKLTADICVVTTKIPFIYNQYVQPINFTIGFRDYRGQCVASGYGLTSPIYDSQHKIDSDYLFMAPLEIMSRSECTRLTGDNMKKFICTYDAVSDISKGDSGGPLVCKKTGDPRENKYGVLVGVITGAKKILGRYRTLFIRVSSYTRFLRRNQANVEKHLTEVLPTFFILIVYIINNL